MPDEVDLNAVTIGNMYIDSNGAGESVVNPDDWPNIDLKLAKRSVKGQRYVGPGGEKIDNTGELTVKVRTERYGGGDVSSRATFQGKCACCRYSRRRVERTHDDVLNLHTGFFSVSHTTHTTQTTPRETEREEKTEEKSRRQKTEDRRQRTGREEMKETREDTRHKTQDTRHKTQDTRHKTQDRGQRREERGERREEMKETREEIRRSRDQEKMKLNCLINCPPSGN